MLHDLLFALMGFPGDIIVSDSTLHDGIFHVKPGYANLTEPEKEKVDEIAPLGWYNLIFEDYIRKYDLSWTQALGDHPLIYKMSLCGAIRDLQNEYLEDVADLEQLLNREENLPLSHFIQKLKKYSIVFPQLHSMLITVDKEDLKGCQIIDYFAKYSTGVPIVMDLIKRILYRLRVPLLKQIFGWMVFGELQDDSKEFFIQAKHNQNLGDRDWRSMNPELRAVHRWSLANYQSTESANDAEDDKFDWYSSYFLRLENIPDSHISPLLATKVVFAGKAAKMLQSKANRISRESFKSDAFSYLSAGSNSLEDIESNDFDDAQTKKGATDQMRSNPAVTDLPFKKEEIDRFDDLFKSVLLDHESAVELLEKAIDTVCDTISQRLWGLLRDQLGFFEHLQVVRNTFLMGKGELMQCILDDMHSLSFRSIPHMEELDEILNWKVLRNSSKLVGLNDEDVGSMIKLRANSNVVNISRFLNGDNRFITMAGVAKYEFPSSSEGTSMEGMALPTGIVLCVASPPPVAQLQAKIWKHRNIISIHSDMEDKNPWTGKLESLDYAEEEESRWLAKAKQQVLEPKYLNGATWFSETKFVTKGFQYSTKFSSAWNEASTISSRGILMNSQRAFNSDLWPLLPSAVAKRGERRKDIILGTVAGCVHGDSRTVQTVGSGELCRNISNSLLVGVSFHACVLDSERDTVKYYARVFAARGGNEGFIRLPANRHIQLNIGDGHAPSSSDQRMHRDDFILGEAIIDIDNSLTRSGLRSVSSLSQLRLDISYTRSVSYQQRSSVGSVLSSVGRTAGTGNTLGDVSYRLQVRLVEEDSLEMSPSDQQWDLDLPLDLSLYVRAPGGQAWVGAVASGVVLDDHLSRVKEEEMTLEEQMKAPRTFHSTFKSFNFEGRGTLHSFPVCSPFTSARYPDTYLRLEEEVSRMRALIHLKLEVKFPSLFKVIFDSDSTRSYERIFSLIMKVRLVSRFLEKLWMSRTKLITDRLFCNIRHAMHFFISNLLYYLQVDVVDSEYLALQRELIGMSDFQAVLQAHRHFLANILRLSMIDNIGIQESFDRILQVCLRFVAACRLQSVSEHNIDFSEEFSAPHLSPLGTPQGKAPVSAQQAPSGHSKKPREQKPAVAPPVFVPVEEFEAIRKEFFLQITYLLQFMRQVESRGFLFRLDFNGFLSQHCLEI